MLQEKGDWNLVFKSTGMWLSFVKSWDHLRDGWFLQVVLIFENERALQGIPVGTCEEQLYNLTSTCVIHSLEFFLHCIFADVLK